MWQATTKSCLLLIIHSAALTFALSNKKLPVVVNTWAFLHANQQAWRQLVANRSALDAIEIGCSQCELDQCDGTVGWGGSPSESGETTLDAMIMDGETYSVGAVGGLRDVKSAVSVARAVMERTSHTLLVGEMATQFAAKLGFKLESLSSDKSRKMNEQWKDNSCQPNYWRNVVPDPQTYCGPYKIPNKAIRGALTKQKKHIKLNYTDRHNYNNIKAAVPNHDTIGMVAIDSAGRIASGTSTNGLKNKILGRVGDSPIPGAGSYAAGGVGAAAATGDGDLIMRHLLSYQAVEYLRQGNSPSSAALKTITLFGERVKNMPKKPMAAIVVLSADGNHGAACIGIDYFPYSVSCPQSQELTKIVQCI